ncbi:MAG: HesA/MoeB/ThiF family protein [Wolinella sp.]
MIEEYFGRQIELMGEESLHLLHSKKVAIIGCGGLGCSIGIALAGSGVGELHLVDFDKIALSNIHRQIAFRVSDVGRSKCEVLSEFLISRALSKGVNVRTFGESFREYASRVLEVDLIMDATDNFASRAEIDAFAKHRGIPWIYTSVEAWHGMTCFMECSDFQSFKAGEHTPKGVLAPMAMHLASLASLLALRYLAGLEVRRDVLHYCTIGGEMKLYSYQMPKLVGGLDE